MATTTTTGPDLVRLHRSSAHSTAARDLLDRAARLDAEMGFGPPRPHHDRSAGTVTVIAIDTCLHRHDVDHDDAYVLAGVLTIRAPGHGAGTAELVVDPLRRSIGVATAVLEELGIHADREHGWAGTGLHTLQAVAHGSHPAAERLARRSGVATSGVRHHLVLPAGEATPSGAVEPSAVRDGGAGAGADDRDTVRLTFAAGTADVRRPGPEDPAEIAGVGTGAGTTGDERCAALAGVIASAVGWLRGVGADAVEVAAADDDEPLLEALRTQLFEHDRSDLVFRIG